MPTWGTPKIMTTIHIKIQEAYVDRLMAILSKHQELKIDDIQIDRFSQEGNVQNMLKKQKLMQIARDCATLPTLDHRSPDQILGYDQSDNGLWGND